VGLFIHKSQYFHLIAAASFLITWLLVAILSFYTHTHTTLSPLTNKRYVEMEMSNFGSHEALSTSASFVFVARRWWAMTTTTAKWSLPDFV